MFSNGGANVKNSIVKAMQYGKIVDVMYMSKSGNFTKRRIKVLKLYGESFQVYCFLRNTKRTFLIDNVLALIPVERKESAVI
jgi:predicted DNA-binding transcriptional regulator YafY